MSGDGPTAVGGRATSTPSHGGRRRSCNLATRPESRVYVPGMDEPLVFVVMISFAKSSVQVRV